ncbi:MAG: hypothetical protein AB8I08_22905 [Sandaracinaceae bacterium]
MSFWEDSSPAVKGIVIVGVLAIVYLIVARVGEFFPFGCENEGSCTGVLCLECEAPPDAQQRGFRAGEGELAEPAAEE